MNVPFYFWTWRDKFFHSIAIKAKLKHPCKSELFHLRSFYVMLKWMFLISGDGTAKHVPSSSRSQHNKSCAGAECVCTRADTKIDESLNDSEIFLALLSALTPKHVGKSCRFPIGKFSNNVHIAFSQMRDHFLFRFKELFRMRLSRWLRFSLSASSQWQFEDVGVEFVAPTM